ncbi:MAG: hypothetical protein ACREQC_17070 [Candidatus Binataceae bacterium]
MIDLKTRAALIVFATATALMIGVAHSAALAQEAAPLPPAAAANAATNPGEKIVGVWKGITLASCSASLLPDRCNAEQKVEMTVIQGVDGKLKGFYKCAYDNQDCFHEQATGKVVSATINGALITMRVMLPDGTGYIFTGRTSGDVVNGGYTASSGGAPLERGVWRARKTD